MVKKASPEYFCVCVRRNYEDVWRIISRHDTRQQAEASIAEKRAYTGVFNYDNAEFRVLSRSQGKAEFGSDWEYHPIGEPKEAKPAKAVRKPKKVEVDE